MPRAAQASAWWTEVDEVRERIERRRAAELAPRRGVREVSALSRVVPVRTLAPPRELSGRAASHTRRRPRPRGAKRIGPRPDRIAAWAVWLGLLLIVVAMLSARG